MLQWSQTETSAVAVNIPELKYIDRERGAGGGGGGCRRGRHAAGLLRMSWNTFLRRLKRRVRSRLVRLYGSITMPSGLTCSGVGKGTRLSP